MNKSQLTELLKRVDEVLYYFWDPIGVSDEPCAREEYTSYTSTVLKFTLSEDISKITQLLNKIQSDSMGLPTNSEHNKATAERLVEYKVAVENGLK